MSTTNARLPLLEREAELLALERVVRRAAAGDDGGLVVVEGAAGIGKSRLLDGLRWI